VSKRSVYWGIGIALGLLALGYLTFDQLMQFAALLLGAIGG